MAKNCKIPTHRDLRTVFLSLLTLKSTTWRTQSKRQVTNKRSFPRKSRPWSNYWATGEALSTRKEEPQKFLTYLQAIWFPGNCMYHKHLVKQSGKKSLSWACQTMEFSQRMRQKILKHCVKKHHLPFFISRCWNIRKEAHCPPERIWQEIFFNQSIPNQRQVRWVCWGRNQRQY